MTGQFRKVRNYPESDAHALDELLPGWDDKTEAELTSYALCKVVILAKQLLQRNAPLDVENDFLITDQNFFKVTCSFCGEIWVEAIGSRKDVNELRASARLAGWFGEMTRNSVDACPNCVVDFSTKKES